MEQKNFWVNVLTRLKPTISKAHFLTWFQNTVAMEIKEDKLIVGVPNAFALGYLENQFSLKILQAVQEQNPVIKEIEYVIHTRLGEKENFEGVDVKKVLFEGEEKSVRVSKNTNQVIVRKGGDNAVISKVLNGRYRLHNFIAGRENQLPHAACSAVANFPGGIYNPLYIYGGVGLGKTHLLQAVGNEILKNFPDKVVKYVTAERFVTEVVEAIGKRYTKKFKEQYRNVDILLIDDIQFFSRKNSSQQEFFHTFNELYDTNKQIILASDRPPSELEDLDKRLTSRFAMGMVIELLAPDFETRVAILQEKCREYQLLIDPEILEFIAQNMTSSVRELEGVLRQLSAEMQLNNSMPTIRSVADIIRRMNRAVAIIGYDIEKKQADFAAKTESDVLNFVAGYFKVAATDLVGNDRHKELMVPRQLCMYLIKNELGQSYEKIGLGFGGRNHTTVMHACNRTAQRLKKDLNLVRAVNAIKREMGL